MLFAKIILKSLPTFSSRFSKTLFASFVFALMLSSVCVEANAATFTVTNLNDSGAGSLRQAIIDANTAAGDDIINFQSNLTGSVMLTEGQLSITSNVSINGLGASVLTVERSSAASTAFRIFNIAAQRNVSISNLTIKGGVANNSVPHGAGINNAGTLYLTGVVVTNNTSSVDTPPGGFSSGGGIYNTGVLEVSNSTISGNRVLVRGSGGGIYNSGNMTLTNTTISQNIVQADVLTISGAVGAGGGIFNAGVGIVDKCLINNNSSSGKGASGGGMANFGTLTVTNTTVSNNRATNGNLNTTQMHDAIGGGISNQPGTNQAGDPTQAVLTVKSSTITLNTASAGTSTFSGGGGIGTKGTDITTNLTNTIVANNTSVNGADIRAAVNSGGGNLIGNSAFSTGWIASDILNRNPLLAPLGDYGGPTQTFALLPNSPAIDAGINADAAATDQRGAPRIIGGVIDIGAFESNITNFDFDGDGKSDISIFRPSVGEWWYLKSSNGGNAAFQFGNSTDKIVPSDYTGDGKTDIAVWRPSTGEWFVLRSEDGSYYSFPLGTSGDIPAPADFDADGKTDAAVFRPSTATWYISFASGGNQITQFGQNGDVPVVADYDGDNKADLAIYRVASGQWWIQRSTAGLIAFQFGNSTDKPVQGDYTGDGKADVALFRPSTGEWFILRSENQSYYSFPFGTNGDTPAPGDYDGDGKFDAAVFRQSNNTWFVNKSTGGNLIQSFGQNGDIPVPNAFVP
jgi:hypothetical protein